MPLLILAIPLLYFGKKFKWSITPTLQRWIEPDTDKDDEQYPSSKNLEIDFRSGNKYIYVLNSTWNLKAFIEEFLDGVTGSYSIDRFEVADNGQQKIIKFPSDISFYDYHLFVQHFDNELGIRQSFGVYISDKLQYYVFQDTRTLNNLVGFTSDKKLFSIYMLHDLDEKQHLRLNNKLKIDNGWIERINRIIKSGNEIASS